MLIPRNSEKEKFYIATSLNEAYACYDNLHDALQSYSKFEHWAKYEPMHYEKEFQRIRYIVKVTNSGKEIVWEFSQR